MSVKRTQWEEARPKGRCQCHACGDGEAQGQNCGCRHGNAPFLVVWSLPEQSKDFRDRHHVLELFGKRKRPLEVWWPNFTIGGPRPSSLRRGS
jgi:hypothetical protein